MKPENLVTVVFMGDSITAGQYVDAPHRWVDIVANNLTRSYLNTPLTLVFVVSGVSGETTRQGLERFPKDVQIHRPDIVTLQFGLNDCNCWATDHGLPRVSEDAYRANLIEMIDRSRTFGGEHVILSNNHTTLRHKVLICGKTLEERRKQYNETVKDVASQKNVTFCDIESAFRDLSNDELEGELLAYPDWLHLSHEGHKRYAAQIEPVVRAAIIDVVNKRDLAWQYEEAS